jgi:hypothetical protein
VSERALSRGEDVDNDDDDDDDNDNDNDNVMMTTRTELG